MILLNKRTLCSKQVTISITSDTCTYQHVLVININNDGEIIITDELLKRGGTVT